MLYLIVIGICIGSGILAQIGSIFPGFQKQLHTSTLWAKLQQYIFLPALFGSRRLEPLPGYIGYVPGRTLSLFIGFYITMNVILSSVSFRNFSPNTWFASPQFEMCEYVGNRTGTLSLMNMSIAILFAGRNNILIAITGWSQTAFLTLHRWAARVAALQAVVHSIAYTMAYFEPVSGGAAGYAAKAAMSFYVCSSILCFPTHISVWFQSMYCGFLSDLGTAACIRFIRSFNYFGIHWHLLPVVGNYRNDSTLPSNSLCNTTASHQILRVLPHNPHRPCHSRLDWMLVPSSTPLRVYLWLPSLALYLFRFLVCRSTCQISSHRLLQSSRQFNGYRGRTSGL